MKQLTINGNRILLVEVPEGASNFRISPNNALVFDTSPDSGRAKYLPRYDWQLLFASPLKPTEEEAAGEVDYDNDRYYRDYGCRDYQLNTAIESWNSLVASHGFTPGRVVGMIDRKK